MANNRRRKLALDYQHRHGVSYMTALNAVTDRETVEAALDGSFTSRVSWLDGTRLTPRELEKLEIVLAQPTALGQPFWEYLAGTEATGKLREETGPEGRILHSIHRREAWVGLGDVDPVLFKAAAVRDYTPPEFPLRRSRDAAQRAFQRALYRAQSAFLEGGLTDELYAEFERTRARYARAHTDWIVGAQSELGGSQWLGVGYDEFWTRVVDHGIASWPLLLQLDRDGSFGSKLDPIMSWYVDIDSTVNLVTSLLLDHEFAIPATGGPVKFSGSDGIWSDGAADLPERMVRDVREFARTWASIHERMAKDLAADPKREWLSLHATLARLPFKPGLTQEASKA